MQRYSQHQLSIRLLIFALGSITIACGVALFMLCETGTDPFGVLMQGFARMMNISYGVSHFSLNGLFLIVIYVVNRQYIHSGTFVSLLCIGPVIDLASAILRGFVNETLSYPIRFSLMLVACVIIGFSLSFLLSADVGVGANDTIAPIISEKLHIPFQWGRMGVDLTFIIIGFLLGGTVGVGTIASMLLIGPVAQRFIPFAVKIITRLTQEPV